MHQGGAGMKQRQPEEDVSGEAMPLRDGAAPGPVTDLWQVDEIEQIVATHERVDDAQDDHGEQQGIEQVVGRLREDVENAGLGRRKVTAGGPSPDDPPRARSLGPRGPTSRPCSPDRPGSSPPSGR